MFPTFVTGGKASGMLKDMLNSWRVEESLATVRIVPYLESWVTRQEFADVLGVIGPVLEEWLGDVVEQTSTEEKINKHDVRRSVVFRMHEWGVWRDWWWRYLEEHFPTFAKFGKLEFEHTMREYN